MSSIIAGLGSGLLAGIAYATAGYKAQSAEFDSKRYLETVAYGALIGLVSVAFGMDNASADAVLAQMGGIFLIKKLEKMAKRFFKWVIS